MFYRWVDDVSFFQCVLYLEHLQFLQEKRIGFNFLKVSVLKGSLRWNLIQNNFKSICPSIIQFQHFQQWSISFLSDYRRKATSEVNRKVIMQLFRTISADDDLFSRLGEHIGQTNIFIAIERNSRKIFSDILPHYLTNKPGFKYPPTNNRCKLTSFILR